MFFHLVLRFCFRESSSKLGAPTPQNGKKHSQNSSAVECLSVFDHLRGWRSKSYKALSKRCYQIFTSLIKILGNA